MLRPPPFQSAPQYPVTSAVAAAAIVVSVMNWNFHQDISASYMDYTVWDRWQVWRALMATFPHGNAFHLLFNLYFLWVFGTLLEKAYGHLRFAAIYVLLAMGSMLADFAVAQGGIGLSGVGYGFWGMLMVLQRYQFRFSDTVDRRTNEIMIAWFFICIVMTMAGVMSVANVAHGAGAVLGMLLGLAIAGEGATRWKSRAGLVVLMGLIFLGATVFWPWVNLSRDAGIKIEAAALAAIDRNDYRHATKLLEICVQRKDAPAHAWYNLGVAYVKAGREAEALTAFEHAAEMPDADDQMREVARFARPGAVIVETNQPGK